MTRIELEIKIRVFGMIYRFTTWLCGMGHTPMYAIPRIQVRFSRHSDDHRMLLIS